jgi:outer membrane PBP1 activator LpoA protein
MQDELKASLDVHLSQERINQLKVRMRQNIKTEARNRRDIDMIYLVGSPKDSRLLKPYIDVNISPFAELVPIFSSSRSHGANTNESDNRDLSGLVFTEIPWLLPSKQQNRSLVQTSKQLWPKRTESLEKIFAMGFDSYALASKLPAMKQLPYVRHYGQTGTLKLNDDNILTRSLLWGRYRKDRVQEIAFE